DHVCRSPLAGRQVNDGRLLGFLEAPLILTTVLAVAPVMAAGTTRISANASGPADELKTISKEQVFAAHWQSAWNSCKAGSPSTRYLVLTGFKVISRDLRGNYSVISYWACKDSR
ncbi:hypothetical protein, partial [Xanthomonas populi]|uniref:hypothetical protein n=1 Tax=Xanthomonas populi TaxID=53414 RepID=UPI001ABFD2C6